MAAGKVGIQWSPCNETQYIRYGPDICLYEVEGINSQSNGTPISDSTQSKLLGNVTDLPCIKAIAWSPHSSSNNLFAVGQINGRVLLTSCTTFQRTGLVGKEFAPRHQRPCTYLSWHPTDSNLLVQGLELNTKFKTNSCINVWDISTVADIPKSPDKIRTSFTESVVISKPYLEIGVSESSYSFSWLGSASHGTGPSFITGLSSKTLKIFDFRDPTKAQAVTTTKAVYGVCVDPLCPTRMASYNECNILIWDKRSFERPVLTLMESKPIVKIDWCPTRLGSLACLTRDNNAVKVYDIRHHAIGTDDVESFHFERSIVPAVKKSVSAFSWHPTNQNRLLALTSDMITCDVVMHERAASVWSPNSGLLWSCGKDILTTSLADVLSTSVDPDISLIMKQRAKAGYGKHVSQIWQNAILANGDPMLQRFWYWLDLVKGMIAENQSVNHSSSITSFVGVKSLLDGVSSLPGVKFCNDGSDFRMAIYESESRSEALQLAGWSSDPDSLERRLLRMQKDNEYEQAATIALFNLKLCQAIEILNRGAEKRKDSQTLTAVAMALSGYSQQRRSLWHATCSGLRNQLTHPYLRAMFAFLLADDEHSKAVLGETDIAFRDRIGFACMYLNDASLQQYMNECCNLMTVNGDLDGILLTGLGSEGLELIQSYINKTGDVQTAAVLPVCSGSQDMLNHPKVQHWICSYKKLLNRWMLWNERSEFDILLYDASTTISVRPPAQVFVSCNFCGKSIHSMMPIQRLKVPHFSYARGGISPHKTRITSCPGCKKPLPRCALCLKNMGTDSGTLQSRLVAVHAQKDKKICDFANWFTWCQTCRHGGHAGHMADWFAEHTECPVSGCLCSCVSLNSMKTDSSINTIQPISMNTDIT